MDMIVKNFLHSIQRYKIYSYSSYFVTISILIFLISTDVYAADVIVDLTRIESKGAIINRVFTQGGGTLTRKDSAYRYLGNGKVCIEITDKSGMNFRMCKSPRNGEPVLKF